MKVDDLKSLASKLVAHTQKQNTEGLFQQFLNVLGNSLRGTRQQPVSPQKDQLFASLRSFDGIPLTYSERRLFSLLGYGENVGDSAVEAIESILHDEKFDPAGVLQKIDEKFNAFKQFIERKSQSTDRSRADTDTDGRFIAARRSIVGDYIHRQGCSRQHRRFRGVDRFVDKDHPCF